MGNQEFDKWLKDKVASDDLSFAPKGWDAIKNELHTVTNTQKVVKVLFWKTPAFKRASAIAASLLLILAITFIVKHENHTTPLIPNEGSKDPIASSLQTTESKTNQNSEALSSDNPKDDVSMPQSGTTNHTSIAKTSTYNTKIKQKLNTPSKSIFTPLKNQKELKIDPKNIVVEKPLESKEIITSTLTNETKEQTEITQPKSHNIPTIRTTNESDNYYYTNTNSNKSNNIRILDNIGLGAGYNYGNMNAGYAVALSMQKDITNNLFIDGSLGLAINNNSTIPTVTVSESSKVLARPTPGKTFVNSPTLTNETPQLLYVQFNPSIGYNFNNKITFSIGSDIQRMVNNQTNDEIISYNPRTSAPEIIPSLDLGLTGKTEITLSKNIKTGVVLRNGINNMFQTPGAVSYTNRRYIQVQFRYLFNFKKNKYAPTSF